MTFEEIIEDKLLLLPKAIPKKSSYREFINDLFEKYLLLLQNAEPKKYKINGLKSLVNFARIIDIQKNFIQGIQETIDLYFDGKPSNAYEKLKKTIEFRQGKYKKILNIKELSENENFYRIRIKSENFPLSALEMFHIPFESRGKVSTQRYSIPGFPSLYLAKTIYVAWEELNRPGLDNFQVVRFKSKKNIKVLDLTANDWGSNVLNKDAYKYLMTWPLIAACSIKVKEYNDTFKPEYIIPQLLLQWVREKNLVDGIMYNSTHISSEKLNRDGELYNLVLPVRQNKDIGYCNYLVNLFDATATISKQLMDYSTGGGLVLYNEQEIKNISNKIPEIEIIKGQKFPYGYSVLGLMELRLDYMPTNDIQSK